MNPDRDPNGTLPFERLSAREARHLRALLDRIDHRPDAACSVAGCSHHPVPASRAVAKREEA